MQTFRPFLPLCAVLAAASVFAQQEIPPPPRTPATPPPNPSNVSEPKVSAPTSARKPAPEPAQLAKPEPAPRSSAKTTPIPVATPLPVEGSKPGFWQRIFGPRKTRMVPVTKTEKPEAEATPKPRAKSKPPTTAEKTEKAERPRPAADEKPKAEPEKAKTTPEPKATPRPKSPPKPVSAPPKTTPAPAPGADADPETVERYKFAEAKRKALEDSAIQDLKLKADTAPSEDDARKALRTYNKALFKKMKAIDPSISERIDATEAAILKRLGGE